MSESDKLFIYKFLSIILFIILIRTFSGYYIKFDYWTLDNSKGFSNPNQLNSTNKDYCEYSFWGLKEKCYKIYYSESESGYLTWYYYDFGDEYDTLKELNYYGR